MDKNAIKKFAIWARNELIEKVTQKAQAFGIEKGKAMDPNAESVNGTLLTDVQKTQRKALIKKIDQDGFSQVMEEVAYTWFNRFIALRFMEVNGYLPSHVRVFTDENNRFKPQILSEALHLELDGLDTEKVYAMKEANQDEDLFKYLLIVQCNALNAILPGMFQKIADYTELLLPDYLLREGSVIEKLVTEINENDWYDAVEIIGWFYQYYISEPKDSLINAKKQYKPKDVPLVTQIFTTDWIVKYMVQNSLGRLWVDSTGNQVPEDWQYYLLNQVSQQTERKDLDLEKIKIVDPCMGSGHILSYAFDVLLQMYEENGYSSREASRLILKNNIYGFDISKRAYQLSYFSIMMKARKYSRNILNEKISPNLFDLSDVPEIDNHLLAFVSKGDESLKNEFEQVISDFKDIEVIGSLLIPSINNYERIECALNEISDASYSNLIDQYYQTECATKLSKIVTLSKLLNSKYDVVVTNPPYIGNRLLPAKVRTFIEAHYKKYKSDIFSAFMCRVLQYSTPNGYIGMLTPYVWMFISTYEQLRRKILNETTITSLVQLEYNAFEAACVPVCAFTLRNGMCHLEGEYIRLSDFKGADIQGPKVLEAVNDLNCGYRYHINQKKYNSIPGSPIAYWIAESFIDCFNRGKRVDSFAQPKQGLATADNNRFLRLWFEVDIDRINFEVQSSEEAKKSGAKWFPYNKGGGYKKWYGNNEYVINWESDGYELRHFKGSVIRSPQYYFREGISWCKITSSSFSMRYIPAGFLFDVAGCTLFVEREKLLYLLGYMNSSVNAYILALISPTLNYEVGHIGSLPIIFEDKYKEEIEKLVKENINLCKEDWDSYENSWDFKRNPLITNEPLLSVSYGRYKEKKSDVLKKLKDNEENLNKMFCKIYSAEDVVTTGESYEDVVIGRDDYQQDMKALISYSVGCMFGRYSLDFEGIAYAGGEWNDSLYNTFIPDKDNIIPICDDEYFADDIVTRFVDFMKSAFGSASLEDNLQYVANAFPYEGSARSVIRQYFINDFYKDHCDLYTSRGAGKRPIYWLFDSGKKNGFKCLIYMHRYQPDTIARIRTDYVHEQQSRYRTAIEEAQQRLQSAEGSAKVKLNQKLKKLQDQDAELHAYEEKIHHLADQMISIDLDDGVKHNYAIFQDVLAKIK